jgi:hypothetical protein
MAQVSNSCPKDNLFERLGKSQTISRQILSEGVPLMVSRLGMRFPYASLRGLLYPVVQEVVVARKIGGIQSHEEYNMLRKNGPEAEFTLLQKIQETTQKNTKNLRDNVRNRVINFFKDDTDCDKVNYVKFEVFGVGGCEFIMAENHHVFQAFNALPAPTFEGESTLARRARRPAPPPPPLRQSASAGQRPSSHPLARARLRQPVVHWWADGTSASERMAALPYPRDSQQPRPPSHVTFRDTGLLFSGSISAYP